MRQMIKREMLKKPKMSTSNSNHSLRLKEPEEEVVAGVDCGRREGVGVDICIGELRDCLIWSLGFLLLLDCRYE